MRSSILEKLYKLLARKNVSRMSLFTSVIIAIVMMRIDAYLAGFGGKGAFYLQLAFTRSNFMEILSSWRSGGVDLLIGLISRHRPLRAGLALFLLVVLFVIFVVTAYAGGGGAR